MSDMDAEEDGGVARLRIASALEATGAYDGPLDIDLGNLCCSDPAPIDPAEYGTAAGDKATAASLARGRDVLQRLVAELFSLPSESDVNGRYVQLPPGATSFPRTKPLPPQEKPMTKWEKFAKEKGIKKRKRSKMVFDEQTDEWKRRHGYDKASDPNRVIIMDGKWTEKGGNSEDPFTKEDREKKERVEKNTGRQTKNMVKAVASHGAGILPPTLQLSANPKKGIKNLPLGKMKKDAIKDLTAHVARSTASIGKYNAPMPGDEKIKSRGKRRQFDSVTDFAGERSKGLGFIDKLMRREKDFDVDVNVAARKIQKAKEADNRAGKKAKLAEKDEPSGKGGGKKGGKTASSLKVKGGVPKRTGKGGGKKK